MYAARLSDSPKDSYFAGAASSPVGGKSGMADQLSASPGAGSSPVRRPRGRALHAAVISLELKGEDRCLVRMDVSAVS